MERWFDLSCRHSYLIVPFSTLNVFTASIVSVISNGEAMSYRGEEKNRANNQKVLSHKEGFFVQRY